jgi:iron complex outermembrane receptor protein
LPTLNERFWQPGGNPEISPEDSYSAEIGLQGKINNNFELSYSLSGYRMWVDNWILWVPDGVYWSPVNIKEVEAYGLEVSGYFQHDIPWGNIRWNADYALNRSTNQTGIDSFDRSVGKQLAYVPIHKASFTTITQVERWFLLANASFTSKRYVTADNEESLPGFTLINMRVGKNIKLFQNTISGYLSVNNLLNAQYQNVANKAMPGVNFMAGITINYHKP